MDDSYCPSPVPPTTTTLPPPTTSKPEVPNYTHLMVATIVVLSLLLLIVIGYLIIDKYSCRRQHLKQSRSRMDESLIVENANYEVNS